MNLYVSYYTMSQETLAGEYPAPSSLHGSPERTRRNLDTIDAWCAPYECGLHPGAWVDRGLCAVCTAEIAEGP